MRLIQREKQSSKEEGITKDSLNQVVVWVWIFLKVILQIYC